MPTSYIQFTTVSTWWLSNFMVYTMKLSIEACSSSLVVWGQLLILVRSLDNPVCYGFLDKEIFYIPYSESTQVY